MDTTSYFETLAVHAGRADLADLGVHAPPIDLSSTYPLHDIVGSGEAMEVMAAGGRPPTDADLVYSRVWNPTVARFEDALAALEGAETSVAFASGMAAMTAVILASCQAVERRHVVALRPLYGSTDHLLESGLLGVETTFCGIDQVAKSLRDDTGLIVVETPANPSLELVDIAALVETAGEVPVLVDNTFATPVLQQPLAHGAAFSLHSATKYLGGHGDVIAGAVACSEERAAGLRRVRVVTGGLLHPIAGYLLHRGLATLPIRMRQQQETAAALAAWLQEQPEVAEVLYPTLAGDPDGVLEKQMSGPGAIVAIRMRDGFAAASKLASGVELVTHAVSLGGVDTLIQHPASFTHRAVNEDARPDADLLRISVGLEHVDDLKADLRRALSQ